MRVASSSCTTKGRKNWKRCKSILKNVCVQWIINKLQEITSSFDVVAACFRSFFATSLQSITFKLSRPRNSAISMGFEHKPTGCHRISVGFVLQLNKCIACHVSHVVPCFGFISVVALRNLCCIVTLFLIWREAVVDGCFLLHGWIGQWHYNKYCFVRVSECRWTWLKIR